jgi:hypothetical protein
MNNTHTCSGCGLHFASSDAVSVTITMNYAEFCTTDNYCFQCRYEITRALNRLHKKGAKVNHG